MHLFVKILFLCSGIQNFHLNKQTRYLSSHFAEPQQVAAARNDVNSGEQDASKIGTEGPAQPAAAEIVNEPGIIKVVKFLVAEATNLVDECK